VSGALRIAIEEWRCWLRSRLLGAALAVFGLLVAATAAASWQRIEAEHSQRESLQRAAEQAFTAQPDRHPHRMVHYGHYVFRTPPPLAVFDPGIDAVAGQALFLEGHRQNSAGFADAAAAAGGGGFGLPSPALAYLVFVPLLLVALGHAALAREREAGTLATLLAQGVGGGRLVFGKAIALGAAALLMLLPAALVAGLAVAQGEAAGAAFALWSTYAAYLGAWVALVLLAAALLPRRAHVLAALLVAWVVLALVLPRHAASVAADDAPPGGKLAADLALLDRLREAGDGHDATDPAFEALRARLLAEHSVARVEDLPLNFRGVVAGVAEARLTALLDEAAEQRMAAERAQSARLAAHAWLSPTLATGLASRALAGTGLSSQHRFLREAEALRFAFVQGLNEVHARQLQYADDVRRSVDPEAERRTRVSASNWALLREFTFAAAPAAQRRAEAAPHLAPLAAWLLLASIALALAARRLSP
jgi:ABC-2 type transport system permease protein